MAYWKKGETKQYRIRKLSKTFKEDSLTNTKIETDGIAEVSVVDSTAKSYDMKYTIVKSFKNDISQDDKINLIEAIEGDLSLRYQTDEMGTFEKYHNDDQVKTDLAAMFNVMLTKIRDSLKKNMTTQQMTAFNNYIKQIATSQVLFENAYGVYVTQMHNVHGYHAGINDTLFYRETTISPIGNKPLDLECYFYVASIDTSTFECQFITEKYMDKEAFAKLVKEFLSDIAKQAGNKTLMDEFSDLDMDLYIKVRTFIDLNTGWPTYISIVKETTATNINTKSTLTKQDWWELDNNLEAAKNE